MAADRKLALVTGASSGFGVEFARLLAKDGYDLAIVARSEDKLRALADELQRAHGVNVQVVVQDLSTIGAAAAVFAKVPKCDVLINNAGFATYGRFDTLPEERIHEEMLVDVVTLTELTRAYLPAMRAAHTGRVLNVASTAAFLPGPYGAVYYAAKAYVLSFSQAIAEELAGSGVTVTCLCPGASSTGFQARAESYPTLLFRLPIADATSVASAGYRGMMSGKRLVIPGVLNNLVAFSPRISPRWLATWVSGKLIGPPR
jgi:short-subunit dehydrogenase